jgi:hypothetical protein
MSLEQQGLGIEYRIRVSSFNHGGERKMRRTFQSALVD